MFGWLWHRLLKRRNRRKAYRDCPACDKPISRVGGNWKTRHFQEDHPEYKFKVETTPTRSTRYTCLICNKTFSSFKALVEKHRHAVRKESDG